MTKRESTLRPLIELTVASLGWGFGFVAAIWALRELSFAAITFYRFAGAALFGSLVWFWTRPSGRELLEDFWRARGAGIWLAATILLQTWGLLTTTATKSAFITVLYVVFVPLLAALWDSEKITWRHLLALVVALVGLALMINPDFQQFNLGDFLTLACAMAAAMQIRVLGQVAPHAHNTFNLNLFQCAWTALLSLPLLALEHFRPGMFPGHWRLFELSGPPLWGLFSLTFGSSLIAFFLQVRAQKKVSATTASLLFLMESPFSAFFGVWLLGETLSAWQLAGAALIFTACAFSSVRTQKPEVA